jgi:hypothetical protein
VHVPRVELPAGCGVAFLTPGLLARTILIALDRSQARAHDERSRDAYSIPVILMFLRI